MAADRAGGVGPQISEYARRLYVTIGLAMPRLDTATQGVLKVRLFDSDVRWGASLVLAIWRLSKQPKWQSAGEVLVAAGGQKLLDDLDRVALFLPAAFTRFLDSSQSADSDAALAGSAVFFSAAINELVGSAGMKYLHDWLRSPAFRECARNLVQSFPEPGSARKPEAFNPASQRGTRSERTDLEQRQARSASTPALDEADVARVHLASLGWGTEALDRILKGKRS